MNVMKDEAQAIAEKLANTDAVYVFSSQRDYVLSMRFAGEISENAKEVAGFLYMTEATTTFTGVSTWGQS